MWTKMKIDNSIYMIKHIANGLFHKIHVTDLIHLWSEEIDEVTLLNRCKEMNKLVEATDEVFLGHVLSLINSETNEICRSFSDVENGKVFSLQTSLGGFKFRIKFFLTSVNNKQFFEEVTLPLLTVISELEKRQTLLVDVIKSKDVEILEYKLEGGQISRKAVETKPFDTAIFSGKCSDTLPTTKSCVAANPTDALTPTVQQLMEKISNTPLISTPVSSEVKPSKIHVGPIKLKSPVKHKKLKIYEDDEEDNSPVKEIKKEEVNGSKALQIKREHKQRQQKTLLNL